MYPVPSCILPLAFVALFSKQVNGWGYVEIFRDDFNGASVDSNKWNRVMIASAVNDELQYYVDEEAYLTGDGKLILRSRKRNYGDRQYTSGRVDTRGKFSFTYGEVEWRAILPKGKGIWPALWLVRTECEAAIPCAAGFWPPEIDVMEARGDIPYRVTHAVHYDVYPANNHVVHETYGPDYSADFHVYKAIWDPNQIVFYVDGQERYRVTDKRMIPTVPMYLVMNTAVGGNYPGHPDWAANLYTEFVIDYVTVHRWQ